jgi:hypothetical protein
MKPLRLPLAAAVAAALLSIGSARADEKFLGTVAQIQMSGSASAVATLKADDGKTIDLVVDDAVTLEKFKDRRIGSGDLIKAKYEVKDGKNRATYFKKPGGC